MKVLHIGNLKSGIDTYVRNTVAMAGKQFEFVIVSGADDNSAPYMRDGQALKNYKICMFRALNPFKDIKAIIQAVQIIRKEKPTVIHCHSAKGGVIGRVAGFVTNTPTFYTPHAFSFLSAESALKRRIFLILERLTRLNACMLACSQSEKEIGMRVAGYAKNKSFAWNNAIQAIDEKDIKIPERLTDNEKFIISIGRPSYQKNPLLMVETMKRVHEKYPDVKFYLIGVGFYSPMLDEMKARIHDSGLDNIVKLVPWLEHREALGYLRRACLYITTSLYEGLPIAVLEAMAMRKAVIASDVIGNQDCVKDGYNGYLLPMDADIFAEKACSLIENNELRKKMGENSARFFFSDFLISNRIGDLERIYLNYNK